MSTPGRAWSPDRFAVHLVSVSRGSVRRSVIGSSSICLSVTLCFSSLPPSLCVPPSVSDVRPGRGRRSPVLSRSHWFAAAPRGQSPPVPPPHRPGPELAGPPRSSVSCSRLERSSWTQRGQARRTPGVSAGTQGCRTALRLGSGRPRGTPGLSPRCTGVWRCRAGTPRCGRTHHSPRSAAAAAQGCPGARSSPELGFELKGRP